MSSLTKTSNSAPLFLAACEATNYRDSEALFATWLFEGGKVEPEALASLQAMDSFSRMKGLSFLACVETMPTSSLATLVPESRTLLSTALSADSVPEKNQKWAFFPDRVEQRLQEMVWLAEMA
jgi:hypothetical protein